MKRQLTVVTVDSAIVGVLCKIPHIFTNAEYADTLYFCRFCDGSAAAAAVEEYRRRFPTRRIPDRTVFSKVFNTLRECGTLPRTHAASERARQHVEEQVHILEMVQRSPAISTLRPSTRLGVSRTRVWPTFHEDGLYPFHPQRVQNLHPGDSAMRPEFCHWLHINRQLLPLILFTDEATLTRNGINNTRNSHR